MNQKMDTDHCWHHGYEPIPQAYYIVCTECGHCYRTAEELLDLHNGVLLTILAAEGVAPEAVAVAGHYGFDVQRRVGLEIDPAAVHFCPLCTHDF